MAEVLSDKSVLQIQNHLKKIWLQEFYKFCATELGETSKRVMCDLLKFESDLMTIQIIDNFSNSMNVADGAMQYSERQKYISKVGYLYPERSKALKEANDFKQIQAALECSDYSAMLSEVTVTELGGQNEMQVAGKTLGKLLISNKMADLLTFLLCACVCRHGDG